MTLAIKNLSHRKGHKALFRHINIELQPGQRVLVQGDNGSGKSTLLKIVAGLLSPDKGKLTFQGYSITSSQAQYFNQMSYLGHQNSLKKSLTPIENIHELLALGNTNASVCQIKAVVDDLGLSAHLHQLCETLSAGECRKVALAGVILKNKPLWILDEPFNSLDKASYHKLQAICQQHLKKGGMILLACHLGSEHYEGAHVIRL